MAYVVNSQHSTYIITDEVQEAGDQRIFHVSQIKFDQVINFSYSRSRTHKKNYADDSQRRRGRPRDL